MTDTINPMISRSTSELARTIFGRDFGLEKASPSEFDGQRIRLACKIHCEYKDLKNLPDAIVSKQKAAKRKSVKDVDRDQDGADSKAMKMIEGIAEYSSSSSPVGDKASTSLTLRQKLAGANGTSNPAAVARRAAIEGVKVGSLGCVSGSS